MEGKATEGVKVTESGAGTCLLITASSSHMSTCQSTRRTETGSLLTHSIFGGPAFERSSTMNGDMATRQEVQSKPDVKGKATEGGEVATAARDPTNLQDTTNVQDATSGGGDNVASNTEATPVRIPYNNGFGDFYFGRCESEKGRKSQTICRRKINWISWVLLVAMESLLSSWTIFSGTYAPSPLKETRRI
jgi:hypothetical protein